MAIPKSSVLKNQDPGKASDPRPSLEKSHNIGSIEVEGIELSEVEVFNDYVAVLRVPRESTIVLTEGEKYTPVGVIVGIGSNCVNKFSLGQNVVINPRDPGIITIVSQGGDYAGHNVCLYTERNVYYAAKDGPNVTVNKKCSGAPCTKESSAE
jgi:hypothetical protein